MTQLYIDNQEVALPEDFTFELIRENPLFTKGGSFTLDISINLDIPVNARLYRHLNRFTSGSNFKNRSARLIVDSRTVLDGTEIILEVNELSASIQLASGNSELNFLIGGDSKMSSLNLGTVPILSVDQAKESQKLFYPDCNYVCTPVKTTQDGNVVFLNNFPMQVMFFNPEMDTIIWETSEKDEPAEIRPMPYLNFVIEQSIKSLGYNLKRNALRDTVYNRLFIVHGSNPHTWGELLGEKTVTEFLTDVENMFAVNIIVWPGKEVEILFRNDFYANHSTLFTPELVEERFERSYLTEDDQPESYENSNISYDLPSNSYFKLQNIEPDIRKSLQVSQYDSLDEIVRIVNRLFPEKRVYNTLYIDKSTTTEIALTKTEGSRKHYKLNMVNRFGALIRDNTQNEIKLGIVPVEIDAPLVLFQYKYVDSVTGNTIILGTSKGYLTIPVVEKYVPASQSNISVMDAINGTKEQTQEIDRISVAFWNGCKEIEMYAGAGKVLFPLPTTHYIAPWLDDYEYKIIDETQASLSLQDMNKQLYEKNTPFNPEMEYNVYALLGGVIPNVSDTFVVKGQKFIVKSLHFKITPEGFEPEYQATLYAMK